MQALWNLVNQQQSQIAALVKSTPVPSTLHDEIQETQKEAHHQLQLASNLNPDQVL